MSPSRAVYTVLLGGYERLNEPQVTDSDIDFICLTDDQTLRSDGWEITVVTPAFPSDPVRSQRLLKILGHERLDGYDSTLYTDNAIGLRETPSTVLNDWLADPRVDLAVPSHSYRETLLDEFDELVSARYDDPARLYEQLIHYSADHAAVLEERPYWTAILARRNNPTVSHAMRTWADHVLRYSRRDQLAVRIALDASAVTVRVIEIDNFESRWHRWPIEVDRKISQGKAHQRVAGPLVADIRRLTRQLAEEREAGRNALGEAARAAHNAQEREVAISDDLRRELRETKGRIHELDELASERMNALEALKNSTSWKVTAPLRRRSRH